MENKIDTARINVNVNLRDIKKMEEEIQNNENIILCRHIRPDFDALGSQIALKEILENKYPNKNIYAFGSDNIEDFKFIGENIEVSEEIFENALIISLDTANFPRLESIENEKLETKKIIKIDHHPDNDPYGNINLVDEKMSSTCELLYQIFIEILNYKLNEKSAKSLFIGIFGDTGGFTYSNTTSKTFKRISEIVKYPFEYENTLLEIKEMDYELVKMTGWIYQNVIINNGVGEIKLTRKKIKELGIKSNKISALVNSLGLIKEIKAWILIVEYEKFLRVNLRSKGKINVSKIAEKFDGGGHFNASGASIKTWDDGDKIIQLLHEEVKK